MKQSWILLILVLAASTGGTGCGSKNNPPTAPGSSPPATYSLSTFFGSSGSTPMNAPTGIGVSGSTLWVANNGGHNLQAWTTGGSLITTITANISGPFGVAIGPDGYVYVMCSDSKQVAEFSPVGSFVNNFGYTQLNAIGEGLGVAVSSNYAYASAPNQILSYPISGTGAGKTFGSPVSFGYSGPGQLKTVQYLCLDKAGNVYAADAGNGCIVKYSPVGIFQMAVTLSSGGTPTGVVVDGSENIFALDNTNGEIQEFNSSGSAVTIFGQGDLAGTLGYVNQLAIDTNGNLYADDLYDQQIVVFSKN